jgi:hypothetical protein
VTVILALFMLSLLYITVHLRMTMPRRPKR